MEHSLAAMQSYIHTLKQTLSSFEESSTKAEEQKAKAYKQHVKYMVDRRHTDDEYRQ